MDSLIPGVYDRRLAAALARGAAAAYGDEGEMEAWAQRLGCAGCEVARDERTDSLAFAAANEACGFVVFRGTRDLRNWITDMDCRRVRVDWVDGVDRVDAAGVEVHEGFNRALEAVWGTLKGVLEKWSEGRKNIFFAGHSLGGALAMLAAAGCSEQWSVASGQGTVTSDQCEVTSHSPLSTNRSGLPIWLYTFGQPRVGNAAWARWYDGRLRARSFRVVHAEDVVARMPWLLGLYRHAGTEIFYDALGRAHQDWPWWAKAPSDAAGLWREWRQGKVALLGDHHVRTYVGMLTRGMKDEG